MILPLMNEYFNRKLRNLSLEGDVRTLKFFSGKCMTVVV